MKNWTLVILLFVGFFAFSCSEKTPLEPEPTVYEIQGEINGFVGTVDGTNAFIALLVGQNECIVYVCNGDEEISEWFKGTVHDPNEISLENDQGAHISARFGWYSYLGEVTLSNDSTHSFLATPNRGEYAGIFRVMGAQATQEGVEAGWISNYEGEQRGAFKIGSAFQRIPALRLGDTRDGTSNTLVINEEHLPIYRYSIKNSKEGQIIAVGIK